MYNRGLFARARSRAFAVLSAATLSAVGPGPAYAQATTSATNRLTLEQVQRWAAEGTPSVTAARARVAAADARARSATLPSDPMVSLGLMNRMLPRLGPMRPLNMNQVSVSQTLPLGGKLRLSGVVAERDAGGARASARAVISDARAAAALAFFDLFAADGARAISRENLALLQVVADAAGVLYASGRGRQADVLRANLEVGRMTEEITRMDAMRTMAIARLSGVLARDIDARIEVQLPSLPSELPSLDSLLRHAETGRPAVQVGVMQLGSAEAARQRARRESWPDLEVGLQYGQRPGDVGTERMASLMLGANVPIFARQRQRRMLEEASAMGDAARADLRGLQAETREGVTRAHAEAAQAITLLALYRATLLPTASATVESSLAAYRAGSVDILMLLDSQMAVNRLRQGEVALQAALGKAISELEQMTGGDLPGPPTRNGSRENEEER